MSRLSTDALIVGYSVSMNLSDGARALLTCLGSGGLMVGSIHLLCKVFVFECFVQPAFLVRYWFLDVGFARLEVLPLVLPPIVLRNGRSTIAFL